jgi:lipopolysaccharide export system protein LptA
MMRATLTFAALLAVSAAAYAQQNAQTTLGVLKDPNAPIEVTANNFSADANTKTAIYSGDVVVHQGEVRMRADAVRINVVDGKASKIFAQGGVVVTAPSGTATGDGAVYDVNPRIVTLSGHVVLTKNQNVMRGPLLTVNLITGQAVLGGATGTGGRVQGLFTPSSQATQKP